MSKSGIRGATVAQRSNPSVARAASCTCSCRRWRTSKNYAAVYRPLQGDEDLVLEVILPSRVDSREEILGRFAGKVAPETHALGQPRFRLAPGDFPGPYAELVRAARGAKARPLTDYLEVSSAEDGS